MSQQIIDLGKLDGFTHVSDVKKAARFRNLTIELPITFPVIDGDAIEFYKTKLPDVYVIKILRKVK